MKITNIRIHLVEEEKLKAYVSITIDHEFVIKDMKVIHGNSGLFIAMPSKKKKSGEFQDIAHPINQKIRKYIEKEVFEAYENEIKATQENLKKLG